MAKQTVSIGTSANDGTGDPLRTAFDKINDNFDEVYGANFVTSTILGAASVNEEKLDATNAPTDNYILSYDSTSGGFTWVQQYDGDITGIVAGDGLTGDATSGDASLAVGAGTGIAVNANDIQIADNGVGHDQLANRYTRVEDIATTSGTIALECDDYAAFNLTGNLGTCTLSLNDLKTGQVVDILLSGSDLSSAVITLADSFTTSVISKVGSSDLDTSATNLIQVVCIDDTDGDAIVNYSIATYTTDTTP